MLHWYVELYMLSWELLNKLQYLMNLKVEYIKNDADLTVKHSVRGSGAIATLLRWTGLVALLL